MNIKSPILILIAGASGSGKTTFANEIIARIPKNTTSAVICQDSYYISNPQLNKKERRLINYDHPTSFEWDLMRKQLNDIKKGKKIKVPIYDYKTEIRLNETIDISNIDVIVFEGIYAIYDDIINQIADLKIFIETPKDECLIRRILRDVNERNRSFESVISQWRSTVSPMYDQFVEPSKKMLMLAFYEMNTIELPYI
nr:uridine kinase [Ureaplasma parvum]